MKLELVDYMGSDDAVADAARVSFSKPAHLYSKEQNERLIQYLAKHEHWTPFSHCIIKLREEVPIFVARQRFKHTVGFSYNETSRRYVSDEPKFYYPNEWRSKPEGSVKQGSGDVHPYSDQWKDSYNSFVEEAKKLYTDMINGGVAPEQARMVLPQSMQTEYIVTGSLYAFARAFKLRNDSHAQKEIQYLAKEWDKIIRPLFPKSWSALVD